MPLSSKGLCEALITMPAEQAQGPRQIGDRRRWHRPGKVDVDAGRRQPRLQRGLQHVARNARVLADQHRRVVAAAVRPPLARQHFAGGIAELHHEIRA